MITTKELVSCGNGLLAMAAHLCARQLDIKMYDITYTQDVCTFPLYTLSGNIVGYQQYRPTGDKRETKQPKAFGKYFTYISKPNGIHQIPTAWGLEVSNQKDRRIYLTEGVFKSCRLHNIGLNSLAVLGNNPLHLKSWLHSLGYELISVCDGDGAGKELAKIGHRAIYLPDGIYLDEMSNEDIINLGML